jgi:hypothetical protein
MCSIAKYLPSLYEQFMKWLLELDGLWYPMKWLVISGQSRFELGAATFATTASTLLCTAGISFYVRFLVALRGKCKTRRIGYGVRARLGFGKKSILAYGNASDQ